MSSHESSHEADWQAVQEQLSHEPALGGFPISFILPSKIGTPLQLILTVCPIFTHTKSVPYLSKPSRNWKS